MKPRELLYLLGLRPSPASYGYDITTWDLPQDGRVLYAQWLHPGEKKKTISQEAVNELRTFLAPGDVAIDIGAHTGDSTLPIALAVARSGVALALEPNPYVYHVLKKNSELNAEKTNIVPLNVAATASGGEYEFEYSDAGFCNGGLHRGISKWRHGHAFKLKVRGENLQELIEARFGKLARRIRYVKVDTEGYDGEVLWSIRELISAQQPFLRAEIYKLSGRALREHLYDWLTNLGYELFRVEGETNYRGARVGRRDLMTWRQYDVFCVPTRPGKTE